MRIKIWANANFFLYLLRIARSYRWSDNRTPGKIITSTSPEPSQNSPPEKADWSLQDRKSRKLLLPTQKWNQRAQERRLLCRRETGCNSNNPNWSLELNLMNSVSHPVIYDIGSLKATRASEGRWWLPTFLLLPWNLGWFHTQNPTGPISERATPSSRPSQVMYVFSD